MPQLPEVEELAFAVPDLELATEFFVSLFGAGVVGDDGPMADEDGSSMRHRFNCDVRARVHGSRLLRTPFLDLRLIEATYPGQRRVRAGAGQEADHQRTRDRRGLLCGRLHDALGFPLRDHLDLVAPEHNNTRERQP